MTKITELTKGYDFVFLCRFFIDRDQYFSYRIPL